VSTSSFSRKEKVRDQTDRRVHLTAHELVQAAIGDNAEAVRQQRARQRERVGVVALHAVDGVVARSRVQLVDVGAERTFHLDRQHQRRLRDFVKRTVARQRVQLEKRSVGQARQLLVLGAELNVQPHAFDQPCVCWVGRLGLQRAEKLLESVGHARMHEINLGRLALGGRLLLGQSARGIDELLQVEIGANVGQPRHAGRIQDRQKIRQGVDPEFARQLAWRSGR
jgi:predicted DNA repair protein MutK